LVYIEQAVHPLATANAQGNLCEVHRIALTALMPEQHRKTVIIENQEKTSPGV